MARSPRRRAARALRHLRRTPAVRALASGALAAAAVLALRAAGAFAGPELWLHDRFVAVRESTRPAHPVRDEPEVVLVTIDEDDVRAHGHPLPDATLARALRTLAGAGAAAIGVDLYRDEPVPPGTDALAALAAAEPRIVFVEKVQDAMADGVPPPAFASPERVAASDVVVDSDGVVRRALLYVWDAEGRAHVGLGLRLVLVALGDTPASPLLAPAGREDDPRRPLRLGAGRIERFLGDDGGYRGADDADYQILLDFRGDPAPRMARHTLSALLAGAVPASRLAGRIVLLGSAAESVRDDFRAPAGGLLFDTEMRHGVEIHAQIADQLLRIAGRGEPPVRVLSERAESALVVVVALAAALAAVGVRSARALALAGLGGAGLVLGAAGLALGFGLWLPAAAVGSGAALAVGLSLARARGLERAERAALDRMLAVSVSRGVRDRLWAQRDEFLRHGRVRPRRMTATIVMGDLEGYTSIAERLAPEEAIAWLDASLGPLAAAVEEAGGLVEDFAGDGVKACFGAPLRRTRDAEVAEDARAAVRCAVRAARALSHQNALLAARGLPPARLRLGIHTGEVVAGSLGDENRLKYATVGDTVNVAARLEELPEPSPEDEAMGPCRILISEETRARLVAPGASATGAEGAGSEDWALREVGERTLRGRTKTVRVWRVLPAAALLAGVAFGPAARADEAAPRAGAPASAGTPAPAAPSAPAPPSARGSDAAAARPTPPRVPPPLDGLVEGRGPYVPPAPDQRVPFRRVGGATRGSGGCDTEVAALVPADHAGLTRQESPALAFRLTQATTCPLEVVVNDPRRPDPLLDLRDDGPLGDGVHRVALSAHGVRLEPGVDYTWFVRIVADPEAPAGDPVAGGAIRRVADDVPLAERWYDLLDASSGPARDALLAAEGLAPPAPSGVAATAPPIP